MHDGYERAGAGRAKEEDTAMHHLLIVLLDTILAVIACGCSPAASYVCLTDRSETYYFYRVESCLDAQGHSAFYAAGDNRHESRAALCASQHIPLTWYAAFTYEVAGGDSVLMFTAGEPQYDHQGGRRYRVWVAKDPAWRTAKHGLRVEGSGVAVLREAKCVDGALTLVPGTGAEASAGISFVLQKDDGFLPLVPPTAVMQLLQYTCRE